MESVLIGAGLISALFVLASKSGAGSGYDSSGDDVAIDYPGADVDPFAYSFSDDVELSDMDTNTLALLYAIRMCEHLPSNVTNDSCYQIFYGGSKFFDLSDHPVNTGEKTGVPLPPEMCKAAGYSSGRCVSTAAGAYQFIRPTWNRVRQAGAWGEYLPDFSIASQDEAARRLLIECGAMRKLEIGDVSGAIIKAGGIWASLPGSTAKQNPKPLQYVIARFNDYTISMG